MANLQPPLFLSYASADRPRALAIATAMEAAGAAVWVDCRAIPAGAEWAAAITQAVRGCRALIILCSAAALTSRNVRQELQLAWDHDKPIVPFLLETVTFPDAVAYFLQGRQWVEVFDQSPAAWLPSALAAVGLPESPVAAPVAAAATGDAPPARAAGALPLPLTPLVGREQELGELADVLRSPDVRLVTVVGPGGIGKTRLALHAADRLRADFPDGVWLARLEAVRESDLVLATIARSVGLAESAGGDLAEQLTAWLGTGRHLVLIDNFEQVAAAGPELVALLERCPGLKLLVTSRVSLNVAGEHTYLLGPMPYPVTDTSEPVAALLHYPALKLFVDRARQGNRSFSLTADNAADVVAICRQLEGMPLAIELAAARIKVLTPADLRARLGDRLRVLTSGPRSLPARQQTMRDAIAWSYELLDAATQHLFRVASVFAGGFELAALAAVLPTPVAARQPDPALDAGDTDRQLALLTNLVDHSLVRIETGPTDASRFDLFQMIREFGTDQLAAMGEVAAVSRAHAEWVASLAATAEPELTGPEQERWRDRLTTEHENIRAALHYAVTERDADLGSRIASKLWRFWWQGGHLTEGRRWASQVLALPAPGPTPARAACRWTLGALTEDLGDTATAQAIYREVLAEAHALADEPLAARALSALGGSLHAQGAYDEAARLHAEALRLYERHDDRRGIAASLHHLATIDYYRGEYAAAQAGYTRALALLTALGDVRARVMVLSNLGVVAHASGDLEQAKSLQEQCITELQATGDEMGLANALVNLAAVLIKLHELARARALTEQALVMLERLGIKRNAAIARATLGRIAGEAGDEALAVSYLLAAVSEAEACGDQASIGAMLVSLASIAHRRGDQVVAARLLGATQAIQAATGMSLAEDEAAERAATLAAVRAALGPAAFAAAEAAGAATPPLAICQELARLAAPVTAGGSVARAPDPTTGDMGGSSLAERRMDGSAR